jgi:PAS domain-containing protein
MRFVVVSILIAFGIYAQVVIRERERAERAVEESEVWLSATLNSIGDAVMATDTKGCVTFMNPVAQSLSSWDQKKAIGKPLEHVFNIINEETGKPVENPVTKLIREGMVVGRNGRWSSESHHTYC